MGLEIVSMFCEKVAIEPRIRDGGGEEERTWSVTPV